MILKLFDGVDEFVQALFNHIHENLYIGGGLEGMKTKYFRVPELLIMGSEWEEVVAQVVERWHSVWAGHFLIPGRTLAFFCSELLSIYSHWELGFF